MLIFLLFAFVHILPFAAISVGILVVKLLIDTPHRSGLDICHRWQIAEKSGQDLWPINLDSPENINDYEM